MKTVAQTLPTVQMQIKEVWAIYDLALGEFVRIFVRLGRQGVWL
jgi:hypothetical protein